MIVIGVTGSFGSGKSEISRLLKSRGVKVFDADAAARRALRKNSPTFRAVVQIFGREFIAANGQMDRKKLAERVFSHPGELKKLNTLIHPGVIFEAMQFIKKNRAKSRFVALDVPLLYESHMERLADVMIVVSAGQKILLERCQAKGVAPALVKKILASQWPIRTKERYADYVIKNDGTLAQLKKKVAVVFKRIQETHRTVS